MGSVVHNIVNNSNNINIMKIIFATLVLAAVAYSASLSQPRAISCEECIAEMHQIDRLVKAEALQIEGFLKREYCPTLDESHLEQCQSDLTVAYVEMLFMISHHYFNDGAIHVCEAAGICDVRSQLLANAKQPRPYTCAECVEGLELVGSYMTDPLWVAEYTLYLELNFCVNRPEHCVDLVNRHFPPMHSMAVEQFWLPQRICDATAEVCGATKPPQL